MEGTISFELCETLVSSTDVSTNSHCPGFSFFIDDECITAIRFHYVIMRNEVNSPPKVA